MSQIDRDGEVRFHDASLAVWEEGIAEARQKGGMKGADDWERAFKRDVFKHIIQTLNRLGWTVGPQHYIATGDNNRFCQKGDLKGDLSIYGRHIEFKMFQSVNCPTRPDHEGRYESYKEAVMPYVIWLEMERTRRRIRDYLCNVFSGYVFNTEAHDGRTAKVGPDALTAMEWLAGTYRTSWHFKGENWDEYKTSLGMAYNRKSADGVDLEHGQRVWYFDRKGRIATGIAYYNINNMWWVITGKYGHDNKACFDLYTAVPENIRVKRNATRRRQRIEGLLAEATKAMNFERAIVLRDLIFKPDEPLFVVWHRGHKLYHCSGFRGYTNDVVNAGRFTADEVIGWDRGENEIRPLEAANA